MTNPILNNYIGNEEVILWQYDKAVNLINLIAKWNGWAKVSCEDFWNYFGNKMFPINQADTYGLNVWGNMLGIPRPTIKIPKTGDNWDGGANIETTPSDWVTINTDGKSAAQIEEEIKEKRIAGYTIFKTEDGIISLCKLITDGDVKYDFYGYNTDGYKVVDDGNSEVDGQTVDSGWKIVTIKNELYRGLLKGRYFLMCHTPTVPNYNRYLSIVFGAFRNPIYPDEDSSASDDGENVYRDIFDADGNVKKYEGDDSDSSSESSDMDDPLYLSRNVAIDYFNMTMSFTFPEGATTEEAYMIFQHYDIVYPFPAGIRYPGEFLFDDLVIGLNTDQEANNTETNQNYRNFVDGLVLAEDPNPANPNGGIFSTTDRANYKVPSTVAGTAYIYKAEVPEDESEGITISMTFSTLDAARSERQAVWIDWGNGECGYHYLPAGANNDNNQNKQISTTYTVPGLYPIIVLFDSEKVDLSSMDFSSDEEFELCGGAV